jgi:DNA repair photolyase
MDNPRILDPKSPSPEISLDTFRKLSDHIGPEKVIWRYDPIVLSNVTDIEFHKQRFEFIADKLRCHTFRCIISFVDIYRKIEGRIKGLNADGFVLKEWNEANLSDLLSSLVEIAENNGIEIKSCASPKDLTDFGIPAGKCIDDLYISKVFGKMLDLKKDPSQRKNCSCVLSKDIGMYDSCIYGCQYCYATTSFDRAKINFKKHDPDSSSLLG